MISLNKIFYGLFILMLVAGIYTYQLMWFKSSDELITLLLALLCVLDILSNKNHRRYKGLFWIVGIMTFYLLYSFVGVHYNTPKAIFYDFFYSNQALHRFLCSLCHGGKVYGSSKTFF